MRYTGIRMIRGHSMSPADRRISRRWKCSGYFATIWVMGNPSGHCAVRVPGLQRVHPNWGRSEDGRMALGHRAPGSAMMETYNRAVCATGLRMPNSISGKIPNERWHATKAFGPSPKW